jgi:integrase
MKNRFRLVRRNNRKRKFYCVDTLTGRRMSLQTEDQEAAEQIIRAKNEAERQPQINLQIAQAYLSATDSGAKTRTWDNAFDAIINTKQGETRERWIRAKKQEPFELIRNKLIVATQAEHFLEVLKTGTVSTNVHLRKIHNFCLDMKWLPTAVILRKQWPKIRFGEKRAIAAKEHESIVCWETNPERKAFYELCWHLGGAQGDIARLSAEDVDWENKTICFFRRKTIQPSLLHFGPHAEKILRELPQMGPLFPNLREMKAAHRATEFARQCRRVGVTGVTLHSYRYAWAERARSSGYPERHAMEALGHNSRAVHFAYAKQAKVKIPSLEEYEDKIIPMIPKKSAKGT